MEQPRWFWQGRKNTFWDVRGPCAPSLLWIQNSWKHSPDPPHYTQVLYHQKIKSCSVAVRWPHSQMSKLWNIFLRWHLSFLIFWKMWRPNRVAWGWLFLWLTDCEGTFGVHLYNQTPGRQHGRFQSSLLPWQQNQGGKGGSLVSNWNKLSNSSNELISEENTLMENI